VRGAPQEEQGPEEEAVVGGQNRSLSGGWCEPLVGEWPSTSSAISAEASFSPAAAVVPPSFPAAAPASLRRGGGGRTVDHRRDARPVSASYRSTSSSSVHDVLRRSLGRCVYPCRMQEGNRLSICVRECRYPESLRSRFAVFRRVTSITSLHSAAHFVDGSRQAPSSRSSPPS